MAYRSANKRSKALRIGLYAFIIINILYLFGSVKEISSYSGFPKNAVPSADEVLSASFLTSLSAVLYLICFIVTIILWCLWIRRTYQNLYAMGIQGLRQTPGWTVGWYFIPVALIWKPYEGMKDAWNACSVSAPPSGTSLQKLAAPSIIKIWWMLWVFSSILSRSSSRFESRAHTAGELTSAAVIAIINALVDIVLTIVAIQLVKKLTERQEEKYHSLAPQPASIPETETSSSFTFKQPETNNAGSDFG